MTAEKLTITILGRVRPKKNNRKARRNFQRGYTYTVPSDAFEAFKEDMLEQLRRHKLIGCLVPPPYGMSYVFRMKGKAATDFDNMEASINDILQEAGIIEDDKMIIHTTDNWKLENQKEYSTTITIWHEDTASATSTKTRH